MIQNFYFTHNITVCFFFRTNKIAIEYICKHDFLSKSLFFYNFPDHKHGIEINTNTFISFNWFHIYRQDNPFFTINFVYLACFTFIQFFNIFHNSYLIYGGFSFTVNQMMYVFFIICWIYTYCILFLQILLFKINNELDFNWRK